MMNKNLITHSRPKSAISEAYRVMRTNIIYASVDKPVCTIVVTSSGPGEGKSTTVANLAITMAHGGSRVAIVDCDLRKPKMHKYFGVPNIIGLTNILVGSLNWREHVQSIDDEPNLSLITSGPIPPNPSEFIGSEKMKYFIEALKEAYDYVVVDTPPIGVVTEAALIAARVDGTILVIASGEVEIELAKRSKEALEKVKSNILGVVLNRIKEKNKSCYKYYNSSYYNEDF